MSSALLDLHARLVQVELEAKIGQQWFESWTELLKLAEGEQDFSQALTEIARRMDKVMHASMKLTDDAGDTQSALGEKRPLELEVSNHVEELPTKKKPVTEQPVIQEIIQELPKVEETPAAEEAINEFPQADSKPVPQEKPAEEPEPATSLVQEETAQEIKPPTPAIQQNTVEEVKPVSKLSAFIAAAEVAPPPSPTPPKSAAPKSPSSPSITQKPSSPLPATKAPSSPLAAPKVAPTSPSAAAKAPSSPSVSPPKVPASPTAPAKQPMSPSAVSKAPDTPSATTKPASPGPAASPTPSSPSSQAAPEKGIVKTSEGGHMEIPRECETLFNEIKIRKKLRYILLKIEDWQLKVVKVAPKTATFDDFMKDLPFSDCCYAVYDHERLKSDQYGSRVAAKVFFITWQPVPAPTQLKMLYSTERRTLTAVFKGVEDFVATKKDDILVACGEKGKLDEEDSEDEERGGKGDWVDD